jgi:GNAT superfamily N-acetyltransferase
MPETDRIRAMMPGEAGEVSRIVATAVRADLPAAYAPDVVEALAASNGPEAIARHPPKQTDYVYERSGRLAAMLGLKKNEIGHLFVHPDFARQGIGRRLVAFAADTFRRAGFPDMIVLASLNAAAFYARCGFVEESRGSFDVAPGLPLPYVKMRVRL